jgi:hypothetical protein
MRNDPAPDLSPDKTPHERFEELGKKLMAVPKSEVDKHEAKWQKRKTASRKKR